ncbi:DoxX family protein [Vibrio superstes]|nr:DoxX family protein [Vibrio superstes]
MLIVKSLLVVFFLLASSIKMLGWVKAVFDIQLSFFKKYGLNRTIMFAIGVIEATGASMILVGMISSLSLLTSLGGCLLAIVSVGAIFFHFRFDTWKDAIPSIVTLLLSTLVALPLFRLY